MYTQRFKAWGFVKNLKRNDARVISREMKKRGGKPSETRVRNTVIPESRVLSSIGRHQMKDNLNEGGKPMVVLMRTCLIQQNLLLTCSIQISHQQTTSVSLWQPQLGRRTRLLQQGIGTSLWPQPHQQRRHGLRYTRLPPGDTQKPKQSEQTGRPCPGTTCNG